MKDAIRMAIPSKCSLGFCDDNIFAKACIIILKLGDCPRYKNVEAMFADTIDKLPSKNKSTGLLRAVLSCPYAAARKKCAAVTWLEATTRPKEKKTQ